MRTREGTIATDQLRSFLDSVKLPLLTFLRDIGKHFSVNAMIKKESVQQRLQREDQAPDAQDADALIDHILTRYHAVHREQLPELVRMARRVEAVHRDHPAVPVGLAALLENMAGFYASQMTAMDNATRNSGDMIKRYTLEYNRSRQAQITKELIEIISGAEAV